MDDNNKTNTPEDRAKAIADMWGNSEDIKPKPHAKNVSETKNKTCGGFSSASDDKHNIWDEISNNQTSSYKSSISIRDLPPVPEYLKKRCKFEKDEKFTVLKCWNRTYSGLLTGILWTSMSLLGFILVLMDAGDSVATNNTILPDELVGPVFLLIFILVGIFLLILGVRDAFSSTWIAFDTDYLIITRGISRNGEPTPYPIKNCQVLTDIVRHKQSISYSIYIRDNVTINKVLVIDELMKVEAENLALYINQLITKTKEKSDVQ